MLLYTQTTRITSFHVKLLIWYKDEFTKNNCLTLCTKNNCLTLWKNEKFTLTEKKFRQMNYLVTLLVTVWKNEKFTVTLEKFHQINSLVLSLVKTLLSRNFCQRSLTLNFRKFHTVLVKPLLSRNFCKKTVRVNFRNFHTVCL